MPLFFALVGGLCAWLTFSRVRVLGDRRHPAAHAVRRSAAAPPRRPAADLAIIIPARNEEHSLPALLASLAHSTVTAREIIVVDDSSTDATADVARRHGVTVVAAPPPPDGWLGKPWACHLGAQQATASRLLFLDADVRLAPAAIAALLTHHTRLGAGLLSVQPFHRPIEPYEQLSALFNIVGPMGTGAFSLVPPARQRTAFGPCLLTTAADYAIAGGHRAIRDEVVEDIALAERYDAMGRQVRVLLGGEMVAFRMYPAGPRSLLDGWTKNIAAGATRAHTPSTIFAALWVATLAAVATSGCVAAAGWLRNGHVPWTELAAWALSALQVHRLLRRVGRFHPLTAVAFVVPLTFFIAVFFRSVARLVFGLPVRWRGRDVPSRTSSPV